MLRHSFFDGSHHCSKKRLHCRQLIDFLLHSFTPASVGSHDRNDLRNVCSVIVVPCHQRCSLENLGGMLTCGDHAFDFVYTRFGKCWWLRVRALAAFKAVLRCFPPLIPNPDCDVFGVEECLKSMFEELSSLRMVCTSDLDLGVQLLCELGCRIQPDP